MVSLAPKTNMRRGASVTIYLLFSEDSFSNNDNPHGNRLLHMCE
jgi:hypothetical protein